MSAATHGAVAMWNGLRADKLEASLAAESWISSRNNDRLALVATGIAAVSTTLDVDCLTVACTSRHRIIIIIIISSSSSSREHHRYMLQRTLTNTLVDTRVANSTYSTCTCRTIVSMSMPIENFSVAKIAELLRSPQRRRRVGLIVSFKQPDCCI